VNAERSEGRHAVSHQPLTTRFVDRRSLAINDNDFEVLLPRRNGCGEPCGASADNQDVRIT
jgi:hypothetical protein